MPSSVAMLGLLMGFAVGPSNPADSELTWQAPHGCPSEADLRDEVTALLRDRPVRTGASARAIVDRLPDGRLRLTLAIEGDAVPGRPSADARQLIDGDCAVLGHAAALMIAVAFERPATPRPHDVGRPTEQTAAVTPPASRPRPTRRPVFRVRSIAGVVAGATPRPGATLGGGLDLVWRRGAWLVEGAWLVASDAVRAGRGVKVALARGSMLGCGRHERRRWIFEPCAAVHAGAMIGRGLAFDVRRRAVEPWIAAGVRGQVAHRLGRRWALWLAGDLDAVLRRPAFGGTAASLGSSTLLFRAPPVVAGLLAGVSIDAVVAVTDRAR